MNILIDVGHPAHVHLFTPSMHILQKAGHKIFFTTRDRPPIADLLEANGFLYSIASKPRYGKFGQVLELIEHDWNVYKAANRIKADLMIGTSLSITHVSKITKARSIVFSEDDVDYIKPFLFLAYPFADAIAIPTALRDKRTAKHKVHDSYHELAYLHPNHFSPDPSIIKELGLSPGEEFFILRLVAFKAHHDVGHRGLDLASQIRLVDFLSKYGKVFITNEGKLPEALQPYQLTIPPHRIHHALYYAKMLVSDGQTMTEEASVLGTPAIRLNTFVGLCSVLEELEHKYELTYGFRPDELEAMFEKIKELLAKKDLKKIWAKRRDKMLLDKIDLTEWIINLLLNFQK